MDKIVEIINDVHCIARRIKAIDRGYSVKYNYTRHRFEVHHNSNRPSTLALVLPFAQLDIRAINYVKETRIERYKEIAYMIERNNRLLEEKQERNILDEAGYKTKHLVEFIKRGGNTLPSYNEI